MPSRPAEIGVRGSPVAMSLTVGSVVSAAGAGADAEPAGVSGGGHQRYATDAIALRFVPNQQSPRSRQVAM